MPTRRNLPHIFLNGFSTPETYKSPNTAPRSSFPQRNRNEHAAFLLGEIREITNHIDSTTETTIGAGIPEGTYLDFESSAGFDLAFKSLDLKSEGIELLSVKPASEENNQKTTATIFVPNGKIKALIKKIEQYRDENSPRGGKPKNNDLVTSIEHIQMAVLKSLWTDLSELFPQRTQNIWWEVWLRATEDAIPQFQSFSRARDILTSNRYVRFPDRHIVLTYTNADTLASMIEHLGCIAELRKAKEVTSDFLDMDGFEQSEWIEALNGLVQTAGASSPAVCILDTGIQRAHSLLSSYLPSNKLHTCDVGWGTNDHHGHGTKMAGSTLYGDLAQTFLSTSNVEVPCTLESVKILPPPPGANDPDLYGAITEEAVRRATLADSTTERILLMAVASPDGRDRGQPSSWSASVDKICSGRVINGRNHLFILSAGNADRDRYLDFPASNMSDGIHDPGQAWNALTVGSYTEKDSIREDSYSTWVPLAEVGDISPSTTTSHNWAAKWPLKPEVVFEGGNAAINSTRTEINHPNSLLQLTTCKNFSIGQPLTWISDTSGAAAQIAHFASKIVTKYPNYWPETVRALIVHSAEWTPKMLEQYPTRNKQERTFVLKTCGYGVPNFEKAISSSSNVLTLISQKEIQPFKKGKMNELHLHSIPWPVDVLRSLGAAEVKMKVTLSYFVEPNPGRRGWLSKYCYQSHGLRFDVKTATESDTQFITRINKERWDEELGRRSVTSASDSNEWYFGKNLRSKGSVHVDVWTGTAADLAERGKVAVVPVSGWWKEKTTEEYKNKMTRYSLVVTISTENLEVDLYTPIENIVSIQETVEI